MKIKTLVAVLLLMGGATTTFAQTEDCNKNSSISHEAVRAKNFKDAYAPCMAVLKDCPTLRYYTYGDAMDILHSFLQGITDRNSGDYKKYFEELMQVHDQKVQYIPEFLAKGMKITMSAKGAVGAKAIDYLQYAPTPDLNQVYGWLKESVDADKGETSGAVLHYFLDVSMQKVKADDNHTDQFFQDYIDASKYADDAIAAETNEKKKTNLQAIKDNLVAMFINSGVADCESLQNIYGPKVEENKTDSAFLKKAIAILKMMKCNESEAYFKVSKDMDHPFLVEAQGVLTRVLGTEFNITAYTPEDTHIVLISGSVEVSSTEGQSYLKINPGENAHLQTNGEFALSNVNTDSYLLWKDGYFYFDSMTLSEIMLEIGRWYNVDIRFYDREAMDLKMRFIADRSEGLDNVITLLNRMKKVNVAFEGNVLVVK